MSGLTVMLVRHAEKAGGDFPGKGTTYKGGTDDKSLVIRGWQRAGAWAALFGSGLNDSYPPANIVYAASPERNSKDASFSHRPYETSLPTAERLNLDPVIKFGVGEEDKLVAEIVELTGVVLVFWEHKALATSVIPALCGNQAIPGLPTKWDGDRFDVVLRFDRALPNAPWTFRQLSPRLLHGDTDAPFKKREEP